MRLTAVRLKDVLSHSLHASCMYLPITATFGDDLLSEQSWNKVIRRPLPSSHAGLRSLMRRPTGFAGHTRESLTEKRRRLRLYVGSHVVVFRASKPTCSTGTGHVHMRL